MVLERTSCGEEPGRQIAPLPRALRAMTLASISAVDLHEWDALVTDNDFFHSKGWLSSLDHALGEAQVLSVLGPAGLLAGCALWNGEHKSGLFCLADFFPDIPGPWQHEFLWIGARRSTHNEIPCISGPCRSLALRYLLSSAESLATRTGCAGVVIPYMPMRAALELVSGSDNATLLLHSAEAALTIPPGGLPEAMSYWKSHDRVRTKAEIAAFVRKGNRVEWLPLSEDNEAAAARFIADNRARYGSMQGDEWMRRMFAGQRKSGVIKSAIAAVAKRDGEMAGLTVFYRFGKSFHARYFGSNYAIDGNDFRYFVLTYYEPMNYAAAHGLRQFRLSTSALKAKSKRGAEIEPLAAIVILTNRAVLDCDVVERHNATFIQQFQQQFAGHLSSEWILTLR